MEFFATVSLYAITGYFIYNIEGIIFGGATHKVYRVPSTTRGTTTFFWNCILIFLIDYSNALFVPVSHIYPRKGLGYPNSARSSTVPMWLCSATAQISSSRYIVPLVFCASMWQKLRALAPLHSHRTAPFDLSREHPSRGGELISTRDCPFLLDFPCVFPSGHDCPRPMERTVHSSPAFFGDRMMRSCMGVG